jgi:hypothetical protein
VTAVRDVLRDAAELLRTKGWTQGKFARADDGERVEVMADDAACFCTLGAVYRITDRLPGICEERAVDALARAVGGCADVTAAAHVAVWNDAPGRTLPEVLAAFERAADLAGAA